MYGICLYTPGHLCIHAVFIADNQGGEDTTRVTKLALMGTAGEVFNVAEIKKQGEGQ